ncbi:hypothetical protein BKA56DRAFT_624915 [Ilyonectria sp. MPI-CAGE-AT-0026]|nr:hypothetical protein BKA56DRAFT_624915 [Ilyonectria sp. MPI-CAGE-AT-0026]
MSRARAHILAAVPQDHPGLDSWNPATRGRSHFYQDWKYPFNLRMQTILKNYLSNASLKNRLLNYPNVSFNNAIEEDEEIELEEPSFNTLISRIRRIITIIKYTQEAKKVLEESILKYQKEGKLTSKKSSIHLDNATSDFLLRYSRTSEGNFFSDSFTATQAGLEKLEKYFPRRIIASIIKKLKPFLLVYLKVNIINLKEREEA